ncbi:YchJ family metal-binding protein [Desulfobulbus sp.]|uniref:YchJ family protein n=1 Tax=Desulfobulbus sp. TaxID=895 RepID=UPI00286FA2F8|nr:YchJ family metal-binding protein [Desulfobulbus sp.]
MAAEAAESRPADRPCPCGSGLGYGQCCGPLLAGRARARTAEALMRSRYTAFVERNQAHLERTWHPSTRPADLALATQPNWCGLRIVATERGGEDDDQGLVEFVATALAGTEVITLHERSRFVREEGQWLYVAGRIVEPDQGPAACGGRIGRNDPCCCGSGRKFKKCCGR